MDSKAVFTGREGAYRRARPGYPQAALRAVIDGLGEPSGLVVADIGAGTGISSRAVADLGPRVLAVEPNESMRRVAEVHPRVEWVDGSAERTGLGEGGADVVLCAQAYHWFDPEVACREFRRVLRPGGRLALVWNDPDEDDAATGAYARIMREGAGVGLLPHEAAARRPRVVGFGGHRELRFGQVQRLTAVELTERAESTSYFPKDAAGATRVRGLLTGLHRRHADDEGRVGLRYIVRVHLYEAEGV